MRRAGACRSGGPARCFRWRARRSPMPRKAAADAPVLARMGELARAVSALRLPAHPRLSRPRRPRDERRAGISALAGRRLAGAAQAAAPAGGDEPAPAAGAHGSEPGLVLRLRRGPLRQRQTECLNVIDEFTHECLAIGRRSQAQAIDVIDVLSACSSCAARLATSAPTTSYVAREDGGSGNRSLSTSMRSRREGRQRRTRRLLRGMERLSAIANTGSSGRGPAPWPSPSSTRDADPGRRPEHCLQGRSHALTALLRGVLPPGTGPSKKGR